MTGLNFVSTEQFRKANPMTYEAVAAAFDEAIAWISTDKQRAAQFYLRDVEGKMSLDDLTAILMAPDTFSARRRTVSAPPWR